MSSQSASSSSDPAPAGVLRSEFAHDPEMVDLVEYFLHDLQTRITSIARAWESANRDELRSLAHQLKGAAGGYGFPTITQAAAELERALLSGQTRASGLDKKVESLIELCRRAAAGA